MKINPIIRTLWLSTIHSPAISNTNPAFRSEALSRAMLNTSSKKKKSLTHSAHSPEISGTNLILTATVRATESGTTLRRHVRNKLTAVHGALSTRRRQLIVVHKPPLTFLGGSPPPNPTAALIIEALLVI